MQTLTFRAGRAWLLAALLLAATGTAEADFTVRDGGVDRQEGVYYLDADLDYRLTGAAEEALENGVPLVIVQEVQVTRERWWGWWWDDVVAELTRRYRLQYHALSRRYVLTDLGTGESRSFRTLSALLPDLGTIRGLPVIDAGLLESGERYTLQLRTRLDIDSLPRLLRTVAYISEEWQMESDWRRWELTP